MFLQHDPDRHIAEPKRLLCPLHRKNPEPGYYPGGCTCSTSYELRPATQSEYLRRRRARLLEERESLLGRLQEVEGELA